MCDIPSNPDGQAGITNLTLREVRTNVRLEPDMRRLVNSYLEKTRDSMGKEEFFYIGRHFERKVKAVVASRIPWVRELAQQMTVLHQIYRAHSEGEVQLDDDVISIIGVALFYFVNPYDIIPDHVPGRGYLDDAYVFNQSLRRLKKLAPQLVEG